MANLDAQDPKNWIPRELFAAYVGPELGPFTRLLRQGGRQEEPLVHELQPLGHVAAAGVARAAPTVGHVGHVHGPCGRSAVRGAGARCCKIPAGAFVGVGVAMGGMARGLLLTTANAQYLKLKRRGLDANAIREALQGRASLKFSLRPRSRARQRDPDLRLGAPGHAAHGSRLSACARAPACVAPVREIAVTSPAHRDRSAEASP